MSHSGKDDPFGAMTFVKEEDSDEMICDVIEFVIQSNRCIPTLAVEMVAGRKNQRRNKNLLFNNFLPFFQKMKVFFEMISEALQFVSFLKL